MASYLKAETFTTRINTLTGGTYGDVTSFNQYLIDGVKDIIHRLAKLDSNKLELFGVTEQLNDTSGLDLESGLLINVRRDTGNNIAGTSTADVRSANKIPLGLKEKVQDHNSLHYRSKYAPVYYLENIGHYTKVFVLPEPSTEEPAHINYVKFSNEGGSGKGSGWEPLDADKHNEIRYFSDKYSYHLVLYAAIRALDAKIAVSGTTEEDFELMQALQALRGQFRNEYDSLFLIGAGQQQPAAPQGRGREARR